MKEQTPIEELIYEVEKSLSIDERHKSLLLRVLREKYLNREKEYAQAKVLETLEKVKEIAWGTGLSKKEYDIFCNEIEKELKQ